MNLVADPRRSAFTTKARFQVVGRADELRGRRQLVLFLHAPAELAVHYPNLLNPDPTQASKGWQLPQQGGLCIPRYSPQQPPAVLADLLRVGYSLRFGMRQAIRLGSGTVPCRPLGLQLAG